MSEADTDAAHAERIKQAAKALNAAIAKASAYGISVDIEVTAVRTSSQPETDMVTVRVTRAL